MTNELKHSIKQVMEVLSKLDDNEKIGMQVFSAKLSEASEQFPEDYTIGMMSDIISRMAETNKLVITKAEIKQLYNKLYSRNTKFADIFKKELGIPEKKAVATVKTATAEYNDGRDIIKNALDQVIDHTLVNELDRAFGTKTAGYTDFSAKAAREIVWGEFAKLNLFPTLTIASGDDKFIVCSASFETPKGQVSAFVPVEMSGRRALIPSVFVGNSGPQDFTASNVKGYIVSNAGKKLSLTAGMVLGAIKNANHTEISDVDLALIKLNSEKHTASEYSDSGIIGQKVEASNDKLTIKIASYQDKEVESFAKSFDSAVGVANFQFGKEVVASAKKSISNQLISCGVKQAQLSVSDVSHDKITYSISINAGTTAFKVPVKVVDMSHPILIVGGMVRDFSKQAIAEIVANKSTDHSAAASASVLFDMRPDQLVDLVRLATDEKEYLKAEEALNILEELGEEKAYQTAFAAYSEGLRGKKAAVAKVACSRIVKNSSSTQSLCGHTGLPLNKVYQDKNGNCSPLYRKAMEDTKPEGATFMAAKILL